jgi:hypothetical protein
VKPRELPVPGGALREFLDAATRQLQAPRSKTVYGKDNSEHIFHTAATMEGLGEPVRVVVVLAAARKRGRTRMFLQDVRQPTAEEWTELGVQPQAAWSRAVTQELVTFFDGELREAIKELEAPPPAGVFRRAYLAYSNVDGIVGEYWAGPWRIGPPSNPPDAPTWGEKVIMCDRTLVSRDPHDALSTLMQERERLRLLLNVFWLHGFHEIPTEHVWVFDAWDGHGDLISRVAQRGYSDLSGRTTMPSPGELAPPGAFRDVDRLNSRDYAMSVDQAFLPPSDSGLLFDRFYAADLDVTERFMSAAKAYDTAGVLWRTNLTGAISYLVVTAESLVEGHVSRCWWCRQVKGVTRATRDLFFEFLPGLAVDRRGIDRFLGSAYKIRSRHFHDAEFVGGELEPWYSTDVLLPARLEAMEFYGRLHALVNGLLVAWLMAHTGSPWRRASEAPPAYKPSKMFSVSVTLGGPTPTTNPGEAVEKEVDS